MGVILCPEHGRSGIALVCPHLVGVAGDCRKLQIELSGFTFSHWFCSDCAMTYSLPSSEQVLAESEAERYSEAVETTQPVCGTCFQMQCEQSSTSKSL